MTEEQLGKTIIVDIEDEVKTSYLNYAMSVIVSRALPDLRDGLKPVHRRILYSMSAMSLTANSAYKKSGRIVGDVLGKYHPHGDQSIYDALVRLAQDFSQRYISVDGQGNYGSLDGDPPAAMRYTEARLTKLSELMLRDIDKETVDFVENYDGSMKEPNVLPAAVPYLLINGATGIAVGMATMIPPNNLREISAAIVKYIDNHDISIEELLKVVKGPDFPTGGIIQGRGGIRDAYSTGKGKIMMRAKVISEKTKRGRDMLVVTEIPYLVNKGDIVAKIADLVRNKRIEGISDLRDESDREGTRIVIELRRGVNKEIVLNQLYKYSQLQENFNVNAVALVNGRPTILNLKEVIHHFVEHRSNVVTRRTQYELRKAKARAHILEGLKIALDNIDAVIALIRSSKDVGTAREGLQQTFGLSQIQAQAILEMRLQKLTSLETKKLVDELQNLYAYIAELEKLLANHSLILDIIKKETIEIADALGDDRRTTIIDKQVEVLEIEDLIQKEEMAVLISYEGYIKRLKMSEYTTQMRGGRGASTFNLRENDYIQHLFIASTHHYIIFITDMGRAYHLKIHQIQEGSRGSRGAHVRKWLNMRGDERITSAVAIEEFSDAHYLFFVTRRGIVKKILVSELVNAGTRGIIAVKLGKDDRLIGSIHAKKGEDVVLCTASGKGLRFNIDNLRPMGRAARGNLGIRLAKNDLVVGAAQVNSDETMLLISDQGYGKRMRYRELVQHNRGTMGQLIYKPTEKTGTLVTAISVHKESKVIITTEKGVLVKMEANSISQQQKTARGVKIISIDKNDSVAAVGHATK